MESSRDGSERRRVLEGGYRAPKQLDRGPTARRPDVRRAGRVRSPTRPASSRGTMSSRSRSVIPQSTWPSTSIPSTSIGSGKRRDENGSMRACGRVGERADRGCEHADDLGLLEPPGRVGGDPREVRMDAPAGRARVEVSELRDDLDGRRVEPDLLLRLAERRRPQVGVSGLRLPAGQPELSAVEAAVVGPHDEHDAQVSLVVAIHRDEHGGRPQRRSSGLVPQEVVDRLASTDDASPSRPGRARPPVA